MTDSNKGKTKTVVAAKSAASTAKKKTESNAKSGSVKSKPQNPTRPGKASSTKLSEKQSIKNVLSKQDNDAPDLNTGTGYPVHPNRIWPD